ncbi:hypothetical protein D3C73_737620 [compost metagenome]
MRFPTHAETAWRMETGDLAWARQEGVRVFGVDTAFHRVAVNLHFFLFDRQRLTGSDTQLLFNQIHAGDHLGNRMLNLNTGVHFDEIELAVFIQELESACAAVTDFHTGFRAALADITAHFAGDARCRSLFNHFLVAALHGAVALGQIDGVTLTVRQHLNFDMAWVFQVFFHVNHVVVESRFGLRLGHGNGLLEVFVAAHYAHAATAAAAGCLDDNRIADALGEGTVFIHVVGQRAIRARYARHASFLHGIDGRNLVAHQADSFGSRANEDKAGAFDLLGEIGVFRQEAVARVDRHCAGDFSRRDDCRDIQVTFYRWRRTDTHGLVSQQYVFQIAIGCRVHGNGFDAQLFTSTQDTKRDLATVGDNNFIKHVRLVIR